MACNLFDRRYLVIIWAGILILITSSKACNDTLKLLIDCGGLIQGNPMVGCFVSNKNTKYITTQNGVETFLELGGELKMEISSRCFFLN